jgi:hypothetical protein
VFLAIEHLMLTELNLPVLSTSLHTYKHVSIAGTVRMMSAVTRYLASVIVINGKQKKASHGKIQGNCE